MNQSATSPPVLIADLGNQASLALPVSKIAFAVSRSTLAAGHLVVRNVQKIPLDDTIQAPKLHITSMDSVPIALLGLVGLLSRP